MKKIILFFTLISSVNISWGKENIKDGPLANNCLECHNSKKTKGDFDLNQLEQDVNKNNHDLWHKVLDQIESYEMPPEDEISISESERESLISIIKNKIKVYENQPLIEIKRESTTRRFSLKEYENSLKHLFEIENVGTNGPLKSILNDSYDHGFNHLAKNMVMSPYYLNAYIESARGILDDIILDKEKPENKYREFNPLDFIDVPYGGAQQTKYYVNIISPEGAASLKEFSHFPESGYYRIKLTAFGVNRKYPYTEEEIGISKLDPITLGVQIGTQLKTLQLPDDNCEDELVIETWVTKNSPLHFKFITDGLKMVYNGNFKFNSKHVKNYEHLLNVKLKHPERGGLGYYFQFWKGPHPRIEKITIEGPFYKNWPPQRESNLIGTSPQKSEIKTILERFASKAYRRSLRNGEIDPIINYTKEISKKYSIKKALKEGIVAILSSNPFLYHLNDQKNSDYQLASKMSYALWSSPPDEKLLERTESGDLKKGIVIEKEVKRMLNDSKSSSFISNFPNAWFELNRLGFMPPEPKLFFYYSRKSLDKDMREEVKTFFAHAIKNNISILDFIKANYSFINQDLAEIYNIKGVSGSHFRKVKFKDQRRGGILGMGAIMTLTADGYSTNPIHRGVWLKSNILGSHPAPPPPSIMIEEPDLRQASDIRELLKAHTNQENCASCHAKIDPYGWAFENYDPTGAWRDHYSTVVKELKHESITENTTLINSASKIRNGEAYKDIIEFKKLLLKKDEQIVETFIKKFITYTNGVEVSHIDKDQVKKLVQLSKSRDYRIVYTITEIFKSGLVL